MFSSILIVLRYNLLNHLYIPFRNLHWKKIYYLWKPLINTAFQFTFFQIEIVRFLMSERTLLKIISWFLPTFHLNWKKENYHFFIDADFIVLSMKIKNTIETSHAFLILLKRSVNNLKTRMDLLHLRKNDACFTLCFHAAARKSFKMWVIKV